MRYTSTSYSLTIHISILTAFKRSDNQKLHQFFSDLEYSDGVSMYMKQVHCNRVICVEIATTGLIHHCHHISSSAYEKEKFWGIPFAKMWFRIMVDSRGGHWRNFKRLLIKFVKICWIQYRCIKFSFSNFEGFLTKRCMCLCVRLEIWG